MMKKLTEQKMIKAAWIFILLLLSSTTSHSQDVVLAGPSGCGAPENTGTWTVPCDVTSITVEVYGGGGGAGGGGGGSNGGLYNTRGGGAGGGGGFSTITIDVVPGSVFTYGAAQGGCGGSNGSDFNDGDDGNAGGNSTFSGTDADGVPINLTANGGARGTGGESGNDDPGTGGAGGSAAGGSTNTTGSAGGNGSGGSGGTGGAGAGPNGGSGGVANSGDGGSYGGGGAGGGNSSGGSGAPGGILITYVEQESITPVLVATPASCTEQGSGTVSNYNASATYSFTPAGPTVGAGGAISGLVAGTSYTAVATISGCTSQASQPFTVEEQLAPPTINVSGMLEYCVDGNTTLTASGAQSYSWDDPSNSNTAEVTLTQGTYTVTGTDANGCTGTETVTVTEVSAPVVDLGPDQQVCGQSTIVVDAGAGATGYTWSNGDDTQTTELGAGNHWVEVSNGVCSASDTVLIGQDPVPQTQIAPSGSQTICNGETVNLDAGSGFDSYTWEPNGEQTQTISVSSSGAYFAIVTNSFGCSASSDTITVTVENVPDADILANGSLEICQGESVTLDAGAGYDTYVWSNGSTDQTTVAQSAGDYFVNGTLGDCTYASDTVTVSVISFVPEISASDTVLSVVGSNNSSYQWYLNGDPIPGATEQEYNTSTSGNYTVVVTGPDGCSGTSEILEYTLPEWIGINETDASTPFVVYPNPSNGHFQLEMDGNQPYSISVLNTIGQVVHADRNPSSDRAVIDLKSSGVYILQVNMNGSLYHKRIVVE